MTGVLIAALLSAASVLLQRHTAPLRGSRALDEAVPGHHRTGRKQPVRHGPAWYRRWSGGAGKGDPHEVPLFVRQLAGLLKAGRPPGALWADIESVYTRGDTPFGSAVLPRISAARRAAELGLSVPDALRQSAVPTGAPGQGDPTRGTAKLWGDLAACLEIAERSGAPLATILEHYAVQIDAELDGSSARDTALAGPRATVVLLAWLPAVGLMLGFALGINPLVILTGTVVGRLALAAGILLMIAARLWSNRLVQHATGGTS